MEFTDEQVQRYSRHIILADVGGKGQKKLAQAKADSSAWAALKAEAAPILTEVQQDLAPVVESKGRQAPLAQRLLWMVDVKDGPTRADGYLRKVIEAGPAATEEDVKNGAAIMSEAKQFVPPA